MKRIFWALIFVAYTAVAAVAQGQKTTDLTSASAVNATDIFAVVINPSTSPANRKLTIDNLFLSRTGNKNVTAYASLSAAVTAISTNTAVVEIPSTAAVSSSLTIPANITLFFTGSGQISVSASQTLTVNGNIEAPLRQIFAGAGSVAFGTRVSVGYPEWFGAVGDGSTNDTTAIDNAQLALSPGAILYLSPRTYLATSGLTLKRSGIVWKMPGMFAGAIKRTTGHVFVDSAASPVENVAFEDVGFDTNNSGNFVFNLTGYVRGLRVTRCRFWKFGGVGGTGYGILASATTNVVVEDSLFHNPGNAAGVAMQFQDGSSNIRARHNRFLYCAAAFSAQGTAGQPIEDVRFEDNYSDEAWPYLVALHARSGAGVTYTNTVLTDTSAAFGSLAAETQVRVMVERTSGGTNASYTRTTLTDSGAPFASVREGDMIRTATAFAIVSAKESNSILRVEEWLSDTDRLPVVAPPVTTNYTVYKLVLGGMVSNTATTVTVDRWFDVDGNSITGTPPFANGTRYEVMVPKPSHAVLIGVAARDVKILDNTLRRSGADQIIATGNEQRIEGNHISYGWDMGITLWGSQNTVHNNEIKHQGVGGVWTNGNDNIISKNQIWDSRWINSTTSPVGGDITVQAGNRNRIEGNICNRLTTVNSHFGILIAAEGSATAENVIQGNTSINHLTADISVYSFDASASGTFIQNNVAGVINQISQGGTGTVTGTRFWNNKATTIALSTGFFTGTYSNAHLRDNQAALSVANGTTVTGTDFSQVKITNFDDGTNREYFEIVYDTNIIKLRSLAAGTGTARAMKIDVPDFAIQIGGADKWGVFATGMLYPSQTNTNDIGSASFQVLNTHSRNWVSGGVAFASLGTPASGTFTYCTDCTQADPCASGGTGAFAKRLNGRWDCR